MHKPPYLGIGGSYYSSIKFQHLSILSKNLDSISINQTQF